MTQTLEGLFKRAIQFERNFASLAGCADAANQQQTNEVFSEKWEKFDVHSEEPLKSFQHGWYLKLYGFDSEDAIREHLSSKQVILDAGCGPGYKAAWLARLAPHATVIGMDFSDAAAHAARHYADVPNLVFLQGDIADTPFRDGVVDYVNCDQVIMHTEDPDATFAELSRITSPEGDFACYFYAKKALPRELVDDYFRTHCKSLTNDQIWDLSEQLTELGKRLSALNVTFDAPDIPALGIKGGPIDIQRFIYWNFLKCFWNEDFGQATSVATNFDWYSPSNARRFSADEVRAIAAANGMEPVTFHSEDAAHSGRFAHRT